LRELGIICVKQKAFYLFQLIQAFLIIRILPPYTSDVASSASTGVSVCRCVGGQVSM